MAMFVENEKTFVSFPGLFPEVRQCIINEMDPTDRVRFTRCSKLSSEEAKLSTNYIHGLRIIGHAEDNLLIYVNYDEMDENANRPGFIIRFQENNGKKIKRCVNTRYEELWREELKASTDMVKLAVDYFKSLLKIYQNRIKHVTFEGRVFKDYDFEIDSMDRLEELLLNGDWDIQYYFSKIQQSLKTLYVTNNGDNERVAKCEQIYQVRSYIHTNMKFNYEQMLRFSASSLFMNIGYLTEREIFKTIRSWQNGTIRTKDVWYCWDLFGSNFDISKLLKLLRVREELRPGILTTFEIKHYNEVGKVAKLKYNQTIIQRELVFDTSEDEENDW